MTWRNFIADPSPPSRRGPGYGGDAGPGLYRRDRAGRRLRRHLHDQWKQLTLYEPRVAYRLLVRRGQLELEVRSLITNQGNRDRCLRFRPPLLKNPVGPRV